jgi:two-component system, sensor histidine kinase ChiS
MRFYRLRRVSLPVILVAPFMLQMLVAAGIIGFLSYRNQKEAVSDLTKQLMDKAETSVEQYLSGYLADPWQIIDLAQAEIQANRLDLNDFDQTATYFWR